MSDDSDREQKLDAFLRNHAPEAPEPSDLRVPDLHPNRIRGWAASFALAASILAFLLWFTSGRPSRDQQEAFTILWKSHEYIDNESDPAADDSVGEDYLALAASFGDRLPNPRTPGSSGVR